MQHQIQIVGVCLANGCQLLVIDMPLNLRGITSGRINHKGKRRRITDKTNGVDFRELNHFRFCCNCQLQRIAFAAVRIPVADLKAVYLPFFAGDDQRIAVINLLSAHPGIVVFRVKIAVKICAVQRRKGIGSAGRSSKDIDVLLHGCKRTGNDLVQVNFGNGFHSDGTGSAQTVFRGGSQNGSTGLAAIESGMPFSVI